MNKKFLLKAKNNFKIIFWIQHPLTSELTIAETTEIEILQNNFIYFIGQVGNIDGKFVYQVPKGWIESLQEKIKDSIQIIYE